MNIAFAFTWLFNPNVGGTERVTDLLATELKRRGHNIYYIYSVHRASDNEFDNPAKETLFIPEVDLISGKGKLDFDNFIIRNKIDVVINQGGVMGTCKEYVNIPDSCKSITVIHFDPKYGLDSLFMESMQLRDKGLFEKFKRLYRFITFPRKYYSLKKYLRNLYYYWGKKSDMVVLLSEYFKESFFNICPLYPTSKLTSICNPTSFKTKYGLEKKKIILWVGRMDFRQKRPDLMVKVWRKVFNRLPAWQLIMLGDGPALSSVKQMAQDLPRIFFPGAQPSYSYFQDAEIFCSSSSSEGWGMVLCEAMSQGAVPIGFDSYASIREMIKKDCQLVKPYNIAEYADKLEALAKNDVLRDNLRICGYDTVKHFSIENIVNKWEILLNTVCNEKNQCGYSGL